MATTYSQLDDVKRILNGVIKFSDSLYSLGRGNRNSGTIDLMFSGVTMDPAYAGFHIRFELRFLDPANAKHYMIYKQVATEGAANMVLIGDGFTDVDKIITDTMTIAAAGFIGTADISLLPNRVDIIEIETLSHMSINNAEVIGNDIEYAIDNILRQNVIITTDEDPSAPALTDVPRNIKIAHSYLWAFRMVDDMFKATRSFEATNGTSEQDNNYTIAAGWQRSGVKALDDYIKTYNIRSGNAPRWIGTAPMITKIGVEGVAVSSTGEDVDYRTSNNDVPGMLERNLSLNSPIDE